MGHPVAEPNSSNLFGRDSPDSPVIPPAASNAKVIIEVIRGPHRGLKFEYDRHDTLIAGRDSQSQLWLEKDPYFSRHQFRLEITPPRCFLVDLGSRGGTFVNDKKVSSTFLSDGDVISGGTTAIRVAVVHSATGQDDTGTPQLPSTGETATDKVPFIPRSPAPADIGNAQIPVVPGFEIRAELGRGAMGVVYRAVQKSNRRDVALKVMLPAHAADRTRLQLFVREASILSSLAHPNILRFYEFGMAGDQFYVATEYVPNVPIRDVLRDQPLNSRIRICCGIACHVLDSLRYAHGKTLVHRDIKPANILLMRKGGKLQVRLADFGLAKNYEDAGFSGMTGDNETIGSPAYMAPEQVISSRYAKPSCDIYSLGVTLYQFLSGKLPFDVTGIQNMLRAILESPPVPLKARCPEIPDDLASAVDRALAKNPIDRYISADEMYDKLFPFSRRSTMS